MEEADYQTTFELEEANWWFVGMRRILLSLLTDGAHGLGPDTRILDVGCGTGLTLTHLQHAGTPVGLDVSATGLGFCRQRDLPRLVQGRGEQLPLPDGCLDAVTAFGVIEHIDADAEALAEWARVLRPGGQVVLLTSAYQWLWSGHDVSNHHVRRYLTGEVRDLLVEAGLEPATVSYVNSFLFPPIAVLRLVERARRGRRPPRPRKDTAAFPRPVDRLLRGLLDVERRLLRRMPLPFGVSLVARATKPFDPTPERRP